MAVAEVRMFDVQKGRDGKINWAIVCNGKLHFRCRGGLNVPSPESRENTFCDGRTCQGKGSEPVDTTWLSHESQLNLGIEAFVPKGMVLVAKLFRRHYVYSQDEKTTPRALDVGTLLADGEGLSFAESEYVNSSCNTVYYVRNKAGVAQTTRVGKEGHKRTEKKLRKLRQGERKSELTYDVVHLREQLVELMQLHRTPEVLEQIESAKELLRLAASLSVEESIEAAEGNEQIACELANARAREISSDLEMTRKRLLLEQKIRQEVREELSEGCES